MSDAGRVPFRESMTIMHQLLRQEISAEVAAERFGVPVERIAIYRDFVRNHIANALAKNYEVLASTLSEELWEELVSAYFQAYPALAFELNANAEQFREFLAGPGRTLSAELGDFHLELAELEWFEWHVYSVRDDIPEPSGVSQPTLNPTLIILECNYPVADYVLAWRRTVRSGGDVPPVPEPGAQRVFVYRDPDSLLAMFTVANDRLLFALKVAHEGISLAEAAAAAGVDIEVAEEVMREAAEDGLVLLPEGADQL